MGNEMNKKKTDWTSVAVLIFIAILVLKGFGVLKALFNIDPDGVTFTFDLGYISSAVLFGLLWRRFEKIGDDLSKRANDLGERIARLEGKRETK